MAITCVTEKESVCVFVGRNVCVFFCLSLLNEHSRSDFLTSTRSQ